MKAWLIALSCLSAAACSRTTGAPAQPSTRPASPRRAAPKYPSDELVKACRAKAREVRKVLGARGSVVEHPPFVVAGDMPAARLDSYAKWSVLRPAKAMWASYFREKPGDVITIFLFAGQKNYIAYAKRDYPRGGQPYFGYYMSSDRRMVMDINTGTGTLVHELTHALIVYDFSDVPSWFNEGLGSLHEQCNVQERGITGLTNWRLPCLQEAVRKKTLRPLSELVTQRDFYGRRQGTNYAQARYFCMYMQKKGLLKRFYEHFRANHRGAGADVRAVEHVFGAELPEIEKAYIQWVMTLRYRR
jgi:hypothetical protein